MAEMVERVARAIQQASFRQIRPDWNSLDKHDQEQWRIRARAAIEEMRKPTEEMMHMGEQRLDRGGVYLNWIQMIDAALREQNKEEKRSGE